MASRNDKVLPLQQPAAALATQAGLRVTLVSIADDGTLWVEDVSGQRFPCDLLLAGIGTLQLAAGDTLFAQPPDHAQRGVVLGRIGRYPIAPGGEVPANVRVDAAESLSFRCGDASIELRADGKLMVKGEDVLVKARGTQRIKAGTVNIN